MRTTVMRISERALYENALAIRRSVPASVKMMCVVKADAYGHGSAFAARAMLRAGADAFAVAIVEEAEELRAAGITQPILILGGGGESSLREAVAADVSQAVYESWMLDAMQDEAKRRGVRAKAHLKIDTGMSRIGVRGDAALDALLTHWREKCPNVEMEGMFTHFCVADSDMDFTRQQNECFRNALARVRSAGFHPVAHAAATSAMALPECRYDMFRAGIGLYGSLAPGLEGQVRHAQTLSAYPVRIQKIRAGESVGYGRTPSAVQPRRCAGMRQARAHRRPRVHGHDHAGRDGHSRGEPRQRGGADGRAGQRAHYAGRAGRALRHHSL